MATKPTNGNVNHQDSASVAQEHSGAESGGSLSKDEVGWYFVEQYYTTMSKSPDKLHLFYGKQSQFVYGIEAEVTNVSVGRQAIADRIKGLELQDCKVRISNVDSQSTTDSIVIQVIGETVLSKAFEPKKFVQTFILAKQPSGYFVLNDMFRYINDESEDETAETTVSGEAPAALEKTAAAQAEAAVPEVEAAKEETVEENSVAVPAQLDAADINDKLEEVTTDAKDTPSTSSADTSEEAAVPAEETTAAPAKSEAAAPDAEKLAQEISEEDVKKAETPKDPTPTPVAPRQAAPVAAEPEKPKEPAKPMTWASRLAAGVPASRPAVAVPKPVTPAVVPATRPAAPVAAPAPTPAAAAEVPAATNEAGSEWQTAGADSKRQTRPQSASTQAQEKPGTLGYVKFVTEKVTAEGLEAALKKFGELVYFDVNRAKNCAFVEFATPAAYQAAAAANPLVIDGESVVVEARRPKANAYGGASYNRGGISGRGRGGYDGPRSGSQSGRGAFTGQTRGGRGGGAPRGRGGISQATSA